MKYSIDEKRAAALLSNAFRSEVPKDYSIDVHYSLLKGLRSVLTEKSDIMGLNPDHVGALDYFDNGGELAFRGEIFHWGALSNGLLEDFSEFLRKEAPDHAVILTTDFQDDPRRLLEAPTIVVLANEIIGGFDLCELPDTSRLLGFR